MNAPVDDISCTYEDIYELIACSEQEAERDED